MMPRDWFFWGSVLVLAVALSWPIARLIWVISVRRLQCRLGRDLAARELGPSRRRAWILGAAISLGFSVLFNLQSVGGHG